MFMESIYHIVIIVYSFSLLYGILLYEYARVYLIILQLMDVWVVFSGGLLQTVPLGAVLYVTLSVHVCALLWHIFTNGIAGFRISICSPLHNTVKSFSKVIISFTH